MTSKLKLFGGGGGWLKTVHPGYDATSLGEWFLMFVFTGSRGQRKALYSFETSKELSGEVASYLRSEFLKCNLHSDTVYDTPPPFFSPSYVNYVTK
jgi:hypothetical protein